MIEKTQYFSILKQLHDVCRNNPSPSLTGMDAYNEIMNFLCLRHMSDNKIIDEKYNLKTLYNKYCTNDKIEEDSKNENLNKGKSGKDFIFYYKELSKDLLPRTKNTDENNNIAFMKIMGDDISKLKVSIGRITLLMFKEDGVDIIDGGKKSQRLINKIYEKGFLPVDKNGKFNINLFPYDGIGEGYEKFMKDSGQEGGNMGQYFTNIQVVNYILKNIQIKSHHKVLDPFAGSGGFILPIKKLGVNKENIYAREHDDKIFKFLKFNSMIAEIDEKNILKGDSFDYHDSLEHHQNYFDIIVSNPPYGMSIDINLQGDEEKKKYWGIMKANLKNTIKDSMGLALYSIIKSLKVGGFAGIVTERGVLNNGTETNSWQKKLRKYLLENTSVKEILLLPKGIFSYTNFDTAVIIFEKGKQTEKIIFNEGYFKDEEKGKSNKTMYVKENILTITIKDIINKDWSLKYDDYVEKKENLQTGIEYKLLGEVCDFDIGGTPSTKKLEYWNGDNLWVSISDLNEHIINDTERKITNDGIKNSSVKLIPKDSLLYSFKLSIGKTSITGKQMYCNEAIAFFSNFSIISMQFFRIYLKLLRFEQLKHLSNSQIGTSLNKKTLEKIKIPILPKSHQEEIVECIEKVFGTDYKELDKMVSKLKDYDLFYPLLNKNYDDFEKLYDNYKDIVNLEKIYNNKEELKRALIKKCFKTVKGVDKTLGEVCEISRGKSLPKSKMIDGKIPVITGCVNINNYHDESNLKAINTIFMARVGSAGDIFKMSGNVYLTDLAFAIYPKNITNDYLFYYLHNFNNLIKKICANNGPPNINTSILCKKLIIPVPSSEDQEKVVKMIEEIEKKESDYNKSIETIKKLVETIYTNIEMKCYGLTNTEDVMDEDNTSKSSKSSKSVKTYKINGIKCIKEDNNYYEFINNEKGNLYAITNKEGEVELVEYITIGKKDYILIDTNVYTIMNNEPDELYGKYVNGKFSKINNEKIIIDGKQKVKTIEELEAELGL
jgi:type I restriction-modification system DNA methylase subunit